MVRIEEEVLEAEVLGNVHDSILVSCPDDPSLVERVVEGMKQCMAIPLTIHDRTFYIPSEFAIGYNWGKSGKDNPRGLGPLEKWLETRTQLSAR
jgi:hypothetical protein